MTRGTRIARLTVRMKSPLVDFDAQLRPAVEVEGLELGVDDARDPQIKQGERPPHVRDVNRLVVPIQYQHGSVGHIRNIAGPHEGAAKAPVG